MGNQHLKPPHATAAENCNLYSGELRPLKKPALAHQFCQPGDTCFLTPKPDDPTGEPPPEPPNCIAVYIVTQPQGETASIGQVVVMTVVANSDATSPVQYQWFQNGIALPGEVAATYSLTIVSESEFTSYTVLVQNPCGEELSQPAIIGELAPTVTELYATGLRYDGWGWNQLVACDLIGQKILINPDGFGYVYVSTDGGDTFTQCPDVPQYVNNTYPITSMSYYGGADVWTVQTYREQTRTPFHWWSTDDGASFIRFVGNDDAGSDLANSYAHGMGMNPADGDIHVTHCTNGTGTVKLYKYANEWTAGRLKTVLDLGFGGATSGSSWATLFMGSDLVSTFGQQSSPPLDMHIGGTGLGSPGTRFNDQNGDGWRIASSPSQGMGYLSGTGTSALIFDKFNSFGGNGTTTVNFDRVVQAPDVEYGNGKFVVSAVDAADLTKLLVVTGSPGAWGSVKEYILPYEHTTTYHDGRQFVYFGGGRWLVAYLRTVIIGQPVDSFVLVEIGI